MKDKLFNIAFQIIATIAIFLSFGCASQKTIIDDEAHQVTEYREPAWLTDGYVLIRICESNPPLKCEFKAFANTPGVEVLGNIAAGSAGTLGGAFIIGGAMRDSGTKVNASNNSTSSAQSEAISGSASQSNLTVNHP